MANTDGKHYRGKGSRPWRQGKEHATPTIRLLKPNKRRHGECDFLREDRRSTRVIFTIEQWRKIEDLAGDRLSFAAAVRLLIDRALEA